MHKFRTLMLFWVFVCFWIFIFIYYFYLFLNILISHQPFFTQFSNNNNSFDYNLNKSVLFSLNAIHVFGFFFVVAGFYHHNNIWERTVWPCPCTPLFKYSYKYPCSGIPIVSTMTCGICLHLKAPLLGKSFPWSLYSRA